MKFRDYLKDNIVLLDGGMGTLLQQKGLTPGELPERWNLTHPEVIREIHKAYLEAGSNVISANTFGANSLKFSSAELAEIVKAAFANARAACDEAKGERERFVALDIGPTGKMLKPLGDLDFEDAVSVFAETVRLGVENGADLIFIETMNDSLETKAAVLAAKENSDLPILVSNAYGEDGKLMTGASPAAMVALLEGLGVDALGANCSLGPRQLEKVAKEILAVASVPVLLKPNAGLPRAENGKTVYDVSAEEFAEDTAAIVKAGVRIAGGCCGTTPEYIRALAERIALLSPVPVICRERTVVSSYAKAVSFGKEPILIGERINPTGKKRLKAALVEGDLGYLLGEGVTQKEKGAHILDVNVGLPEIDEVKMLEEVVCRLQTVIDLPLQIDTANPLAMAKALRRYNGKALINSVNGKEESMRAIFPLVKKYGGVVVALTLDETGIPETAEGRVAIAKRILKVAEEYGIEKKDIIFDTLALTVSADRGAALATLKALRIIREELGCHTSLGVSNVSFGLPARDAINAAFFALAMENGLSGAIMNPNSAEMMKTYYAYRALKGMDENLSDYIAASQHFATLVSTQQSIQQERRETEAEDLQGAIAKGLKEKAAAITEGLLAKEEPFGIINERIIPALNLVGEGFEKKTVYLPQLLMSAEAAKSAFEVIRGKLAEGEKGTKEGVIVIATVRGDIHDIGKNIVKMLLENYGFFVIDLGKDVLPEVIADAVVEHKAPLAVLSALMTTTVPAMEETVKLIHKRAPWCKTVAGGAVMTQEYADKIGADHYAKDAMECVRYAAKVISQ